MNQRDTFLDFCKGTAITLVVLGHVLLKSIQVKNGLFGFIILFHMPFFFILSGYLAWRVPHFDILFFLKKARTLLLPLLTVGMLFTLLNDNYAAYVFNEFHNGYWFLWSLFCIWCLFAMAKSLVIYCHIRNVWIEVLVLLLPFFVIRMGQNWLPPIIQSSLSISFTGAFYRFFVLGYIIGKYSKINNWLQMWRINVSGTLSFIFLFAISFLVDLEHIIPFTITQSILCLSFLCLLRTVYSCLSHSVSQRVEKYGRRSLDVYVFHYFVLLPLNLSIVKQLNALVQSFIAIVVAIIVVEVTLLISSPIEKNKYLCLIFLGKIKK